MIRLNKIRRFQVNISILFEYIIYSFREEIKEVFRKTTNPKFKFSVRPKYAMQLALIFSIIFLFQQKFFWAIFFLIGYFILWLYKTWISGEPMVYYRNKYGLDRKI